MMELKCLSTGLVITASILSGFCWVVAARAKVRKAEPKNLGGLESDLVFSSEDRKGKYDYFATAAKQSTWNTWAASFAAIAAFAQAAQAMIPDLP